MCLEWQFYNLGVCVERLQWNIKQYVKDCNAPQVRTDLAYLQCELFMFEQKIMQMEEAPTGNVRLCKRKLSDCSRELILLSNEYQKIKSANFES